MWERPLSEGRLALAVLNKQEIGGPRSFPVTLATLPSWKICTPRCNVTQTLPSYQEMGVQTLLGKLTVTVNPSGTALLTVTPLNGDYKTQHAMQWQDMSNVKTHNSVL